jgi:glyoxylase-like metal-dependent hydrolase (beta-lactamase superfamily II)
MEFVMGKAALGQDFFEYFGFSCHAFHRLLYTHYHPYHLGLVQYIRSGLSNSELGSTPPQK